MQNHSTIGIIICFYGKFPWYFDYFLHTCRFNPTLDFIIITDNSHDPEKTPNNVLFKYKTLEEISEAATTKLGFKVNIANPYKLCDFKPAYGFIFPELIEKYEFWGWGDIDVIFGNIRNFITGELLKNYDIISVRHDFLTGYFQLVRNNERMRKLFLNSKDYQKVFSSDEHYCFDETNFEHAQFTENIPYDLVTSEIESMMHVICKLAELNEIRPYFDFHVAEGLPGRLKWNNGSLFYKNKYEVILYHLIKFKYISKPMKLKNHDFEEFKISPQHIHSFK